MATLMKTETRPLEQRETAVQNGAAMAAFLAAGVGSFALGLLVVLHEMAIFSAPALYAPAGGLSGRTTLGVALWALSWLTLHRRWREREVPARAVVSLAVLLILLGLIGSFPPVWGLL